MDWITTLLGSTRAQILTLLRRSTSTIGDLAGAVGITGNAVRGHVTALQKDGLVREAGAGPSTGGKPAQRYEITPDAEELYPKAYALVLAGLVDRLKARDGEAATLELLRDVGRRAAGEESPVDGSPEDRARAAAAALTGIGGEISVSPLADGWELRGTGCPLSAVVLEDHDTCELARALVAAVSGGAVSECCDRRDGRARCRFQISDL